MDGKPVKRESYLHTMFPLTWYATAFDVNAEVNNGRGPVDYKVLKGKKSASLGDFKLTSNSSLRRNLEEQHEACAKASQTEKSIKVILYFSEAELERVTNALRELKLQDREDIVLIDGARKKQDLGLEDLSLGS